MAMSASGINKLSACVLSEVNGDSDPLQWWTKNLLGKNDATLVCVQTRANVLDASYTIQDGTPMIIYPRSGGIVKGNQRWQIQRVHSETESEGDKDRLLQATLSSMDANFQWIDQCNNAFCSPLVLAAARGSKEMFAHILRCRSLNKTWNVDDQMHELLLRMDGVDVPHHYSLNSPNWPTQTALHAGDRSNQARTATGAETSAGY